jgi:ATP-dependent DNA helicase RecQ
METGMNLEHLLHSTFGFPAFRANQEAVCRAATEGSDVLLVMPTGAGKSLCYQLPAIARGGTALVISPLIALMDDQAAKITALGLRVARIHSGLSREDARQACRDYLDGSLQFLFIAPERMRVPGFPEMLARRKPSLIAIDEAHCISAWGHDFRPDYRTLGDYLPTLRPAPILALTATATPTVQKDIVAQLNLNQPALFIHGFRRENLAIEVVEMSKPRRSEFTVNLLKDPANRPAIVYAPSRKAAEELAHQLGKHAAPYHAGLDPATRERVQRNFLSGQLEIVVATIAFGMGIDKADVRTVVHIALPGSVEAYYQEIGRAGRDGLPSRTILLHSFIDRKMHDFFLERDYPPPTELARVDALLTTDYQMPDLLRQRLKMDVETFDRAAEKLTSQGAAQIDLAGNVRSTGLTTWRTGYDQQVAFRRSQIDRMVQFAESNACRMTSLIRHFGDTADGTRPCGHCDVCSPTTALASTTQTLRDPNPEDLRRYHTILRALDGQSRATGKLHAELLTTSPDLTRRSFELLLGILTRAGLITLATEQWTNPTGDLITFKKASLTHEGREAATTGDLDPYDLQLPDSDTTATRTRKPKPIRSRSSAKSTSSPLTPDQANLEARLRDYRKTEAAKTGKPAFIVFSDAVLHALVEASPTTLPALLQISGIGPEKADRYGAAITAICRNQPEPPQPRVPHPSPRDEWGPSPSKPSIPPTLFQTPEPQSPQPKATTLNQSPLPDTPLTPDQQLLDTRLRNWRKSESERLGLPQFFVLSSSTLRSIVLLRPRTLAHLQTIPGIGPDKAAKFGPNILELCTT